MTSIISDSSSNFRLPFSKQEFDCLSRIALNAIGMELTENNKIVVYNRLIKRVRSLHLNSFDEYCSLLKRNTQDEERTFINLITNVSTSFFRESYHFDYLTSVIFPTLFKETNSIHILSAGCSTGEEAYSIAMVAREYLDSHPGLHIKLSAIDVNTQALNVAQEGIYPITAIALLKAKFQKRWFVKGLKSNLGLVKVNDALREMISFYPKNLLSEFHEHNKFDVIFFRNVIIYFNEKLKKEVLTNIDRALKPKGFLLLGHSETLRNLKPHYINCGKTTYQKINEGN